MTPRPRSKEQCPSCRLTTIDCLCSSIEALTISTRVVFVLHARELARFSASSPLALPALSGSSLVTYGKRDEVLDLTGLHAEGRRVLVLLPPGSGAPLTEIAVKADERPVTLVVPDGNWRQIHRAAKRIDGLMNAEHVHIPDALFHPGETSTFAHLAHALGLLESPTLCAHLLALSSRVKQAQSARTAHLKAREADSPQASTRLSILYRDDDLIVVNKPSGIAVHRGWTKEGVPMLQRLRDQIGQRVFPLHRLDRATSGVLIFGLSPQIVRDMQLLFDAGEVEKKYLAVCRGTTLSAQTLHHPLAKEKGGVKRSASTSFRSLGTFERYSLVEATPHTGRTHQIRRHLKHLFHPIIGDVRYGKGEHNRVFRERFDFHRLALHCRSTSFVHPRSGEPVVVQAPLPSDLASLLEALGLNLEGNIEEDMTRPSP